MWSILGWCSSVGSKHCDAKHLPQLSPVLPLSPDVSPPLLPPRYLAEMIKNGKKQRIFILNTCNEYARFRTCVHMYIYIMYIYVCIPIYVICTFCLYMYRDTVHVYSPFRAFGDRGSRSWKGFPWSWPCWNPVEKHVQEGFFPPKKSYSVVGLLGVWNFIKSRKTS